MTGSPNMRRESDLSPTETQTEVYVRMEAETEVMCLQVEERQGLLAGAWSLERERHMEQILSESSRNNRPC